MEMLMKTIIAGVLSVIALSATYSVANAQGFANSQGFPPCFQGDTMDRGGGHTGRLGAPQCNDSDTGRAAMAQDSRDSSANNAYGEYNDVRH
jgi:hypothetical protein